MSAEIGPVDSEFTRILFAEDELGAVIRAHILIEAQVNGIIESLVIDPKSLPRLRFEQSVSLLIALGASEELSAPLLEMGRIRNTFAHRVDTRLTMGMIDKWLSSFSTGDRAMMDSAIEKTCVDLGQPTANISEHDAKSKFILISVFVRQVLRHMQVELDAKRAAT
jgi:hypothetical protein